MAYRSNQHNMTAIIKKQKEFDEYIQNGDLGQFIIIEKRRIDKFNLDSNFNDLYNELIILLHATSGVISKMIGNDENPEYKKLFDFHNEFIYPRYEAMKEVIATARLKYFAFYGQDSMMLKQHVLDKEV